MQRTARRAGLVTAAALVAAALVTAGLVTAGNPHERDTGQNLLKGNSAPSWTTVFKSARGIEGLTADASGNLYTADRGTPPCNVFRVPAGGGAAAIVGHIDVACSPSGLTFGPDGRLYVTNNDGRIYVLRPDAAAPPAATVFAEGVPGANGVAFDRDGNLWTGDGGTGLGRVWRISPDGSTVTEMFRVQPMLNSVGVGRTPTTAPGGAQTIVANGVAFAHDGTLLVADTARGAIWRVDLDKGGDVVSPMGCDETFAPDTLCLDDILVEHPYLEGADGIALDRAGNIWVAANERNAIAVVSKKGDRVVELDRSPAVGGLRNAGPLEFPTSPFLSGRTLCMTQSDGNRRDNSPNSAGEVGPGTGFAAKIGCLDQQLDTPGEPLPVK